MGRLLYHQQSESARLFVQFLEVICCCFVSITLANQLLVGITYRRNFHQLHCYIHLQFREVFVQIPERFFGGLVVSLHGTIPDGLPYNTHHIAPCQVYYEGLLQLHLGAAIYYLLLIHSNLLFINNK